MICRSVIKGHLLKWNSTNTCKHSAVESDHEGLFDPHAYHHLKSVLSFMIPSNIQLNWFSLPQRGILL